MKKTALLAAAMFSALLVLPLAACNNTSSFKVDDYALSLDSEYLSDDALADKELPDTYVKLNGNAYNYSSGDRLIALQSTDTSNPESEATFRLYDTETKQNVGESFTQQYKTGSDFYILGNSVSNGTGLNLRMVAPNGQQLVTDAYATSLYSSKAPQTDTFSAYVNGAKKQILSITYVKSSDANDTALPTTTVYFTYSSKNETYTKIEETDIDLLPGGSVAGSQVISTNVTELGADVDNGERPTSLDGWSVIGADDASSTFTFIKTTDGITVRNDLEVKNAHAIGFLKNYLFYYEMEKVESSATSGYNVVVETNTNYNSYSLKYKATLYRYDILNGKKKKLNCDYYIASASDRLYNNNAHDYDKAIVFGYEFHGGVAVVSSDMPATQLVINENASICLDLSTKPFSLDSEILKLSDNRYFCDDTIFDKNFNVISSLSNAKVYKNQSLIVSLASNSRKFAVDFNGKVVLEPIYSSLDFYGDYALTTVYTKTDTKTNYVVSKNNPNGTSVYTLTGKLESASFTMSSGLLTFPDVSTSTIYNLSGSQILSGLSSPSVTPVCGGLLVDDGSNGAYLIY